MNDRNHSDNEPTVQLPKLPVQADEFDPEKTVVVEDWSQVPLPVVPASKNKTR
ncbi:MAG: hypothetical protein ABW034_12125 [Steroidobacteraceae bacterium]